MHRYLMIILLSLTSCSIHASDIKLNETLVRIINQINAIQPLLDEAKNEVDPSERVQLHVDAFIGSDDVKHPGLRDDLLSIRSALIDYINHPVIAPRFIEPLAMDFIQ